MVKLLFRLSKRTVIFILVYYVLLFFIGLLLTLVALLSFLPEILKLSKYEMAVTGSIGMSLIGSSIYYIRKIYKLCIGGTMEASADDSMSLKQLGLSVYFYMRPLFAIGFSILLVVGLNAGILSVHEPPQDLSIGFVHVSIFLSFFAGFLAGDLLDLLERFGKSVLEKLFRRSEGELF